jgi:ribosome biogenesis protein NSA1
MRFVLPNLVLPILMQPAKNSLGIFTPTWFTSVSYLSKDDHRKFVAGTNNHQVILISVFF